MRHMLLGAFAALVLSVPAGPSSAQDTAAPAPSETPAAPAEAAGGFFVVQGLAEGDLLNIRAAASATGKLVGRLPNGTAVRNHGCNETNGVKWCKVEAAEDASVAGWAPARYLLDVPMADVGPAASGTEAAPAETPEQQAAVESTPVEIPPLAPDGATTVIPCSRYYGKPMSMCAAIVQRGGEGEATVTVTWPDGGERVINFRNGRADTSDSAEPVSWTREADLNMIRIGKAERFEIPDALPFGG